MRLTLKFILVCLGSCMFLASGPLLAQQGFVQEVIRGDVKAAIGSGKPVTVVKGQTLLNNTTVTTGPDSMAILKFYDGTAIVLNQNTSFLIQKYEYDEKSPSTMSALFSMVRGALRVITGNISQRNRDGFKLATPQATIGIRGTAFSVAALAGAANPAYMQVVQGAIAASNTAGTIAFAAGTTGTVASATTLATSIAASALPAAVSASFASLGSVAVAGAGVAGAAGAAGTGTAGGVGAAGAAAGGVGGVAVGAAAAAAGLAAGVAGGSKNPTGTTGTTP